MRSVVDLDDLPHTAHAHELVGADHGDVPVSVILVHSAPELDPRRRSRPTGSPLLILIGRRRQRSGEESDESG